MGPFRVAITLNGSGLFQYEERLGDPDPFSNFLEALRRDEAVVGQSLTINGRPYSVVGITEEGFAGMNVGSATQVFVPMMMQADVIPGWRLLDDPRSRFAHVYGRLRPGVSFTQAQASLQPFFRAIRESELTTVLCWRTGIHETGIPDGDS